MHFTLQLFFVIQSILFGRNRLYLDWETVFLVPSMVPIPVMFLGLCIQVLIFIFKPWLIQGIDGGSSVISFEIVLFIFIFFLDHREVRQLNFIKIIH